MNKVKAKELRKIFIRDVPERDRTTKAVWRRFKMIYNEIPKGKGRSKNRVRISTQKVLSYPGEARFDPDGYSY